MSPITRETLAARIATLEADSNISIKEQFYLKTMRLLLNEMDRHPNGLMQMSNELVELKRRYAELEAVLQQRNAECDRLINERQASVLLDTAPAQFDSLAGEPVSQRYKLPEHTQEELLAACRGFLLGATGNKNRDNYFYDQSTDFHVCLHQVAEGMGLVKCVGNYAWVLDEDITKQIRAIYEKYAKLMMGAAMEVEQ